MDRTKLSDDEWERLLKLLRQIGGIHVGAPLVCRIFVESVLWILRTGAQWRALNHYANWNSVLKRYSRWSRLGIWTLILEELSRDADLQNVCIDSTVARAHACAAGAGKDSARQEGLGRSRGGFGCKIHAVTDSLGLPIKFILTGGQAADITQAIPLLTGIRPCAVLADKGYDADDLLVWLKEQAITAVIPARSNLKEARTCDWWLYKERHVVECMFGKLKHYRRVFCRYEKKLCNFMGMVTFAAILLWLR